jgi:WD40 repeat protein
MSEQFDPYYTWLGIPPSEQPANHYRLLGITEFEDNESVISHAADRQMAHLRSLQMGKYARDAQRLLNELSAARVCLLNAAKKREYDEQLRGRQSAVAAETIAVNINPAASITPLRPATPTNRVAAKRVLTPYLPVLVIGAGAAVVLLVVLILAVYLLRKGDDGGRDDLALAPPRLDGSIVDESPRRDDGTSDALGANVGEPIAPTDSSKAGAAGQPEFPLSTNPAPQPPATGPARPASFGIKRPDPQVIDEWDELALPLDPEGLSKSLQLSWELDKLIGSPRGARISPTGGVFIWQPREEDGPGKYEFGIIVKTPQGQETYLELPVEVREKNGKGWVDRIWFAEGHSGAEAVIKIRIHDPDQPPNKLTYKFEDAPPGLTIDEDTGDARWRPSAKQFGTKYVVRYAVSDGGTPEEVVRGTIVLMPPPTQTSSDDAPDRPVRYLRSLHGHFQHARHLAFSPDAKTLYVTSTDSILKQWDVATGRLIRTMDGRDFNTGGGVAAAQDIFVWGSNVWDATGTEPRYKLDHLGGSLPCLSKDAQRMILADINHGTTIWNMQTRTKLNMSARSWSAAIAPSGKLAAAEVDNGEKDTIVIWDTTTGAAVTTIPVANKSFYGLAFTPDEKLIAAGRSDGVVQVWEVTTGNHVKDIQVGSWLFGMDISPDGRLLAASGSLSLWDFDQSQEIETFPEVTQRTWSVAFSPDSRLLAAGHEDGTVSIWEIKRP